MQVQASHVGEQPVVVCACGVFESQFRRLLPKIGNGLQVIYLDRGLHRVPDRLRYTLQLELDRLPEPSLVLLGYGLCGNGLADLRAGRHTLVVPRTDDCIALILGSYSTYLEEFAAEPGTYWLSSGWLEAGSHPYKEYQEMLKKYDQETALWLADQMYQHYRRLCMVAIDEEELEYYRPQALEAARFCAERWGYRYEERLGSDDYVRRLLQAPAHLHELGSDFLVIGPGEQLKPEHFRR